MPRRMLSQNMPRCGAVLLSAGKTALSSKGEQLNLSKPQRWGCGPWEAPWPASSGHSCTSIPAGALPGFLIGQRQKEIPIQLLKPIVLVMSLLMSSPVKSNPGYCRTCSRAAQAGHPHGGFCFLVCLRRGSG